MKNEFKLKFNLDVEKLKTQVSEEYNVGFSTISRKRQIWREQDNLFNGIVDQNKIDLKTVFYNVQAWMATYYTDKKTVEFQPRRYGMHDQAKRLNSLAEFDKDEMDLDILNYEVELNRVLRGVGIRVLVDWDKKKQCPIFKCIDTRNWVPDPNGWFDEAGFRFHGFDVDANLSELSTGDGFYNIKELKDKLDSLKTEGSQEKTNRSYAQRAAGLNPSEQNVGGNPLLHLYYHYTTYYCDDMKPHKIFTCWGADRSILLKVEEIMPVYEEEKDNPALIKFPVKLKYFLPKPYDPAGTSLVDLIQDKHRYKNVLANLMFLREKDAALGDDVIFDVNIIKNPNDLTTPSLNKKFIGADGRMGAISGATSVMPKNPSSPANYNFLNFLDNSSTFATGIDARQMGLQGNQDTTLGEAQQLQANANLKTQYFNVVANIGEKAFWKEWLRSYHENFKSSEKKVVRVTDSFGTKNIEFTKKDFISEEDPDIKIISAADKNSELMQNKAQLGPILMQIMADPNKSALSKNQALRKYLVLNGMSDDEAKEYAPPSYEELDALQKLELINANNPLGAEIDPDSAGDVDHNSYIMVFRQAMDNPVKYQAIEARKQMIISLKQNGQMQGGQQGALANMASSSMIANANSDPSKLITRTNPNQ